MAKKIKSEMTFLEHLEELRWHLVRSAVVIIVAAIVAFLYKNIVFDIIILGPSRKDFISNVLLCKFGNYIAPILSKINIVIENTNFLCINSKPLVLQNIIMAGQFTAHIRISIISGIILGFPYIVYEFWRFISPALYKHERKHARTTILGISSLFFIGVLFGYFIICPLSVNFLNNYAISFTVENKPQLMSYVSLITSIVLAAGVLFELPAIIFFLSKIGLVTPKFLKKYRKHAIVVILIIAAIITPPDIFSQILVSLPLIVLYEFSIGISKRVAKKRDEKVLQ